jgi:predicted nucleic acid-binding protein
VLVYAYDRGNPARQSAAQRLIEDHLLAETGCLSAQVLSEFYVTVTRKLPVPLAPEAAAAVVHLFSRMPVTETDVTLVHRAMDAQRRYAISYWDALIVAAAERAGCTAILAEDLAAGQTYLGIPVVDPSAPATAAKGIGVSPIP